jgi:hypothetical protein
MASSPGGADRPTRWFAILERVKRAGPISKGTVLEALASRFDVDASALEPSIERDLHELVERRELAFRLKGNRREYFVPSATGPAIARLAELRGFGAELLAAPEAAARVSVVESLASPPAFDRGYRFWFPVQQRVFGLDLESDPKLPLRLVVARREGGLPPAPEGGLLLALPSAYLSGVRAGTRAGHFALTFRASECVLEDLGSKNGTACAALTRRGLESARTTAFAAGGATLDSHEPRDEAPISLQPVGVHGIRLAGHALVRVPRDVLFVVERVE